MVLVQTTDPDPAAADAAGEPHDQPEAADAAEVSEAEGGWRHPSINGVIVLIMVTVGLRIGLQSLGDNSFLTHLATGRLILERGGVPGTDPYSWTANGEPWTVQSWGASLIYGTTERVAGLGGIRVLDAILITTLILLLWQLIKPADTVVTRLFVGGLIVCMGTGLWVERPLLFGAVFLAFTLVAADGKVDPRWMVPVMWLWVNTHGSFPFGIVLLVLLALGAWLDDRSVRPLKELRALGWATVGTLLGAINPIGPKILWFPVSMLSRTEAFERVAEWEPPTWERGVEKFFALEIILALAFVLWRNRSWRAVLPLVVFGLAAATSTRNILQASIVIAPILAVGLSGMGSIDGERRPQLLRPVAAALAFFAVLVAVMALAGPNTDLSQYPVASTDWMAKRGMLAPDQRVIAPDFVGNFLEYRYGPDETRVFMDDRVDMYPMPVIRDYAELLDEGGDFEGVIDRHDPTAVVWKARAPFGRYLVRSEDWAVVRRDHGWIVAVPRDTP